MTVYDRGEPARAASWAGAGMLAPYSEEIVDPALLALCDGVAVARIRRSSTSCANAPASIAQLRAEGTLHVAFDRDEARDLPAALRRRSAARRRGGRPRSRCERWRASRCSAHAVRGAVFVANEAHVDNRRLGRALVAACRAAGVRFGRAGDIALEADARRVRGIRTEHGFVAAGAVVNAAGAWAGELPGVPPRRPACAVRPVAGEMLALAVPQAASRAAWCGRAARLPRPARRRPAARSARPSSSADFDVRVTAGGVATLLGVRAAASRRRWARLRWSRPGPGCGRPRTTGGPTSARPRLDGYFVAAGHYRNGILLDAGHARRRVAALIAGEPRRRSTCAAFDPQRAHRKRPERGEARHGDAA